VALLLLLLLLLPVVLLLLPSLESAIFTTRECHPSSSSSFSVRVRVCVREGEGVRQETTVVLLSSRQI